MSAKARIAALVQQHGFLRIEEREWEQLRTALPDVSEPTLRKHLLQAGVPIGQPWRGVDTATLESLEQSLCELTDAYATHPQASRTAVIAAKDKARFAARNGKVDAEKRALKLEMVQWMLVWLDDPRMFAAWVSLRRAVLASTETCLSPEKPSQP